jgi:DNA-binding MarR family transcriptional regulator
VDKQIIMENRNWYAVLTAQVLYDKRLNDKQKLLVCVIGNLQNMKGYCYATNGYLADCMNCDERTIRRNLEVLEGIGYITRRLGIGQERLIYVSDTPRTNLSAPTDTNVRPPRTQMSAIITKDNNKGKKSLSNSTNVDLDITFDLIWDQYGKKVGKKKAYTSFKRLSRTQIQKVTQHIPLYVKHHHEANKAAFLPHLSTYLNQERYLEELPYLNETNKQSDKWKID